MPVGAVRVKEGDSSSAGTQGLDRNKALYPELPQTTEAATL